MAKDLKILIILFKTHQFLFEHVKETLVDCELNLNEFTALEALYSKGKLTTKELISYVLIPNSSMTYILDILEKKELIVRVKDEMDRRIQYVMITKKGKNFFSDVYKHHAEHMRTLFDVLTVEEEKELQRLLKKVGQHAERSL